MFAIAGALMCGVCGGIYLEQNFTLSEWSQMFTLASPFLAGVMAFYAQAKKSGDKERVNNIKKNKSNPDANNDFYKAFRAHEKQFGENYVLDGASIGFVAGAFLPVTMFAAGGYVGGKIIGLPVQGAYALYRKIRGGKPPSRNDLG